jgi:uncharacterized protein (TIGR02594 family)
MRLTKSVLFGSAVAALLCLAPLAAKAGQNQMQPQPESAAPPEPVGVIDEAAKWLGARNPTGKRGPWCAAFANFILQKTGHAAMSGDTVGDAMRYGPRLHEPKVGAMAVISTSYGRQGHVGFIKGVNPDGSIELISGNWGRRVGDAHIPRRQVFAFVDIQ